MAFIFIDYLSWHFSDAVVSIFGIMINYLKAVYQKFLIGRHFKTLFYPWHRRQPSDLIKQRSRNFFEKILDSTIDFYIRILAAFVRLAVIIVGLAAEFIVLIFFTAFIACWVLWPVVLIYSLIQGINLII